jgi:hypothetical protein
MTFTVPAAIDTTAPSVTITSPTSSGAHTAASGTLALAGSAGDNVGVTQVSWATDRGASGVAAGTTAWSIASVPLEGGTTVITVTARDAGNNTSNATLTVTWAGAAPGPATLISPSGPLSTNPPTFTWAAVAGATHYQLWVNDSSQAPRINATYTADAAGCASGTGTCAISPGVGLAPGPGHWWIRPSNAVGTGPWSIAAPLTVP